MELKQIRTTTDKIIEIINTICDFEISDIKFFATGNPKDKINEVNIDRNILTALISGELHYERVLREDEYDYKYMIFQQDRNVFSSVIEAFENFDVYYDNMDEMQGSSDATYLVTDLLRQLAYGNIEYLNCITDNKIKVLERPDYEEIEKETIKETKPVVTEDSANEDHFWNEEFNKLLTEIVDSVLSRLVADSDWKGF